MPRKKVLLYGAGAAGLALVGFMAWRLVQANNAAAAQGGQSTSAAGLAAMELQSLSGGTLSGTASTGSSSTDSSSTGSSSTDAEISALMSQLNQQSQMQSLGALEPLFASIITAAGAAGDSSGTASFDLGGTPYSFDFNLAKPASTGTGAAGGSGAGSDSGSGGSSAVSNPTQAGASVGSLADGLGSSGSNVNSGTNTLARNQFVGGSAPLSDLPGDLAIAASIVGFGALSVPGLINNMVTVQDTSTAVPGYDPSTGGTPTVLAANDAGATLASKTSEGTVGTGGLSSLSGTGKTSEGSTGNSDAGSASAGGKVGEGSSGNSGAGSASAGGKAGEGGV